MGYLLGWEGYKNKNIKKNFAVSPNFPKYSTNSGFDME